MRIDSSVPLKNYLAFLFVCFFIVIFGLGILYVLHLKGYRAGTFYNHHHVLRFYPEGFVVSVFAVMLLVVPLLVFWYWRKEERGRRNFPVLPEGGRNPFQEKELLYLPD